MPPNHPDAVAVRAGRVRAGKQLQNHPPVTRRSSCFFKSLLIYIIRDSDSVQLTSPKLATGMPEPCVSNLFDIYTYLQTYNYTQTFEIWFAITL